tara:strand:- start:121 stop:336 length:216 start_codon:yes stop_codon:yes gene_type:complete
LDLSTADCIDSHKLLDEEDFEGLPIVGSGKVPNNAKYRLNMGDARALNENIEQRTIHTIEMRAQYMINIPK